MWSNQKLVCEALVLALAVLYNLEQNFITRLLYLLISSSFCHLDYSTRLTSPDFGQLTLDELNWAKTSQVWLQKCARARSVTGPLGNVARWRFTQVLDCFAWQAREGEGPCRWESLWGGGAFFKKCAFKWQRSLVLLLPSIPVNYGGVRSQTWILHPPSSSLVYLRMRVFTLYTKCAARCAGFSPPATLKRWRFKMATDWEQDPMLFVLLAPFSFIYNDCSIGR